MSDLSGLSGQLGSDDIIPMSPFDASMTPSLQQAQLRALADRVAEREGVDPKLLSALVQAESGWNPLSRSDAGAQGLTQLMPGTARDLGVRSPFDPEQNLTGGARYLKRMLSAFDGDVRLALAAYNAGPGNVRKAGGIPNFPETQKYVKDVMADYGRD